MFLAVPKRADPHEVIYSAPFLGLSIFKLPLKNSIRNVITLAVDICDLFMSVDSID